MALLELKNIGKIYAGNGNVAVGLKGVNLSFDAGEFVAVTGPSGCGKTTLLNVIGGMDTFEEGQMYIHGEETSPYSVQEWEEYRETYISFIFQDYNIVDSFTVLQNVELALMHVSDAKERKKRALSLLRRVGMDRYLYHKGSQLSGGQKQRTVIARALAKDSEIILADEPTGNLDEETAKEIILLLKEVAEGKLLIMVTHDIEEVKEFATRQIHILDGMITSDEVMSENTSVPAFHPEKNEKKRVPKKTETIRNGLSLGSSIFRAKPALSLYMTLLMMVTILAVFFAFAIFWGEGSKLFFNYNYMFNPIPGRVIIVRNDGGFIPDEDLEQLAKDTGAKDYLHMDDGLDRVPYTKWLKDYGRTEEIANSKYGQSTLCYVYDKDYGKLDWGRYPQTENEVVLRLPLYLKEIYGTTPLSDPCFYVGTYMDEQVTIVGVSYYLDGRNMGEICFTKQGYLRLSTMLYYDFELNDQLMYEPTPDQLHSVRNYTVMNNTFPYLKLDKIVCTERSEYELYKGKLKIQFTSKGEPKKGVLTEISFEDDEMEYNVNWDGVIYETTIIIPEKIVIEKLQKKIDKVYKQASLFYDTKKQQKKAIRQLEEKGYVAVSSKETFQITEQKEYLELLLAGAGSIVLWIVFLVFLIIFVRLCTRKSMKALATDIAIMRSMGIFGSEIKLAVYVRIYISMLIAILLLPVFAYVLYHTVFASRYLYYLHAVHYLVVVLLELWVVTGVARSTVRGLFSDNVRKLIYEGDKND